MTNIGRVSENNDFKPNDICYNQDAPTFDRVPQAFWLQRLRRLRDAFLGSRAERREPMVAAEKDWMADIESSIAALERGLGIDHRNTG